jgi:hypothetical protein
MYAYLWAPYGPHRACCLSDHLCCLYAAYGAGFAWLLIAFQLLVVAGSNAGGMFIDAIKAKLNCRILAIAAIH